MTEATRGRDRSGRAVTELWARFTEGRDPAAREGLILQYASLVKFVAGRVGTALPASVEGQDLISYGTFGLIDAIDKFEPERGFRFETYAVNRIRGAIVDELRTLDWVPRSVRARARAIQDALVELEHGLQRSPTEDELAEHLDMTVPRLRSALGDVAAGGVLALDEIGGPGSGPSLGDLLADPRAADPEGSVEEAELRRILIDSVKGLPERERQVVVLYYFEGMTLAQIGDVLDLTESRISQVHAKAVLSLRNRVALATREA